MRARFVLLLPLLIASAARAQSNYQPSPVAPRAMGMGGAGVATVDGASGIYYSPGSLAFGHKGQLSVSGNLYGLIGGRIGQEFGPNTANTYVTIAAVPTNLSVERHGFKLGKLEVSDRWGFGISVLSPINVKIASISSSTDQSALVLRNTSEFVYTIYAGMAYRIRDNLGIGMALSTVYRQFQSSFDATIDRPGRYLQATQSLTAYTIGASVSFGARGEPIKGLTLGFGLHLPVTNLLGFGDARERVVVIDPIGPVGDGVGTYQKFGRTRKLAASYTVPARITAGLAYAATKRWTIAFDFHLWLPHSYNPLRDRDTKEILSRVDLNWTFNINVGVETWIKQKWPLRFGFFTDRSPTRQVYAGELASGRQDLYGATASVGMRGAISDNEFGVLVSGGPTQSGAVDLASGTLEETSAHGFQWRLFVTYSTLLHY